MPKKRNAIYNLHESIRLSDGRSMGFAELGTSDGLPVILLPSLPASRHFYHPSLKLTEALNIRLIVPERSGIGLTSFHPEQSFLSYASDIAQLMKTLNIELFSVIGFETAIPYALHCAQAMPQAVKNLSLIGEAKPQYLSYLASLDEDSLELEWESLLDFILLLPQKDQGFMKHGAFYQVMQLKWSAMLNAIREHPANAFEKAKFELLLHEQELLSGDWGINFEALKTPTVLYRFEHEITSSPDWHSVLLAKDSVYAFDAPHSGSFSFLFSWWARLLVNTTAYQRNEWDLKSRIHLRGADLSGQPLQGLDLWSWDLNNTKFTGANISDVVFAGANLSGADFSSAIGHRADFAGADLWYTKFNFADMREAVFQGANIRDAYFVNADLRDADFQEAALTQTDFSGANIYRADFNGANMYQAKLKNAKLYLSHHLSAANSATFDARTIMPDAVFNEATASYSHYYQRETDLSRFTNPGHPDFWEPKD